MAVEWPSGLEEAYGNLFPNQYITLTEGLGVSGVETPQTSVLRIFPPAPNPFNDSVLITWEQFSNTPVLIEIADLQGKLILSRQITGMEGKQQYEWKAAWKKEHPGQKLNGYGQVPESVLTPYACLGGDSLVQLGDGRWEKIRRLVLSRYSGTVRAYKDGKVVEAVVTGWHRHSVGEKAWFRVKTVTSVSGRWGLLGPLFTPDHKVLTPRGMIRIDALIPGADAIVTEERQFTAAQMSVFLGCLLGDGGFTRKHNKGVGFGFGQCRQRATYTEWKASVFSDYGPKLQPNHEKKGVYRYHLPFSRHLTHLAARFPVKPRSVHRHRKLIITADVLQNLDTLGLAVWYQDDGTYARGSRDRRGASRIYATLNPREISLVIAWLTDKFGAGISYNTKNRFIQIAGEAFWSFHNAINAFMHPTMAYKTPIPVVGVPAVSRASGEPYYDPVVEIVPWSGRASRGTGVRYCLTVPETGNFLTKVGFVSNCWDPDLTGRLYLHYNGDPHLGTPGTLDADRFGVSTRQIFGLRMRAWGAWAEMERSGLGVDRAAHKQLREVVLAKKDELLTQLRAEINWPEFDPAKNKQVIELLFGLEGPGFPYLKGEPAAPPGSLCLNLAPHKATAAHKGRLWREAVARWRQANCEGEAPRPAADAETLIHLSLGHVVSSPNVLS
jgi:hypothetical protein